MCEKQVYDPSRLLFQVYQGNKARQPNLKTKCHRDGDAAQKHNTSLHAQGLCWLVSCQLNTSYSHKFDF